MEEQEKERKMRWRDLRTMLGPSFKGTGWSYFLSLFLILVAAGAQAAEPVIYGKIVDEVIALAGQDTGGIFQLLIPLVGIWAGAVFIEGLAKELSKTFSWRGAHYMLRDFTKRSFAKVLSWDPERFGRVALGALSKRLDRAWDAAWTFSSRTLTDIVPTVVGFVVFLGVGLYLDWRMAIVSLAGVPLLAGLTLFAYRYADSRQDQLNEAWEEASRKLSEAIQSILPIKAFNGEQMILNDHMRHMAIVTERQEALNWIWTALDIANNVVRLVARMAVVIVGLLLIQQGTLSVGTLITFLGMVGYILAPFDYLLADILRRAGEVRSAFARLGEDWKVENRLLDPVRSKHVKTLRGELTFDHIVVRYSGAHKDTLKDISLRVRAGSSLAIVGPSGSGKSTFVKLINRFLDPTQGRVLLDGIDVRELKISDVRHAVGLVQQETVLLNETVANNIKFAKPSAKRQEIIAAAKKAQAHEFITKMKYGYDTVVGERGARLSGGERQRIALARIFLADPPILILDESTSALDSETEHKLQIALRTAMQDRTTIVIAHRLSTVYMADQIAVIEDGKLVELGTHTDLIREGGMYERLWRLQSGGYLPD